MAAKKLGKKIEGTEVIFSIGEEEIRYDTATLPQDMKDHLIVSGAGHKLGDSAAGAKTPEESKAAIQKVWDGLMQSKWTTRIPGEPGEKAPKLTKSAILANIEKLPVEQQEAAKALLAAMGFNL